MPFDPIATRRGLCDGVLEFTLTTQYEAQWPMGNVAATHIERVLSAWLAGLENEARPILDRALHWLDAAIDLDEEFGEDRDFHRATLHWAKGAGTWMATGADATTEWERALEAHSASRLNDVSRSWTKQAVRIFWLDDYMLFCVNASRYEAGMRMYESLYFQIGEVIPKHVKPRDYGYLHCIHKMKAVGEADLLLKAGREMLARHLTAEWLGAGQFMRAASWLKVVYGSHCANLKPHDIVMKAYDNMPGIARPAWSGVSP